MDQENDKEKVIPEEQTDQTEQSVKDEDKTQKIETNEEPNKPEVKKKKLTKKKLIVILAVLLIATAAATYYYVRNKKEKPASSNQPTRVVEKTVETAVELPDDVKKFITPTTGETWLDTPKKIEKQPLLKDQNIDYGDEFYEVGARAGATIIMRVVLEMGDNITLFEKSGSTFTYIARPDKQATYNENDEQDYLKYAGFNSTVKINKDIYYDSLSRPQKLPISGDKQALRAPEGYLGQLVRPVESDSKAKETEVKQYGKSKFIRSEYTDVTTNITSVSYLIILPIGVSSNYTYSPVPKELDKYQWTKGQSYVNDNITAISRGCGGGGFGVSVSRSDNATDAEMEIVGKTQDGVEIYGAKSLDNSILKKAYTEYMDYLKSDEEAYELNKDLTIQQFSDQHGVVFVKDAVLGWLVYARDSLRPAYGCAKPVVYLYPESTAEVSVKVSANVTISDPQYDNSFGWKVLAYPSGKLVVNGKIYDSLFWEGRGTGQYPGISSGSVIRTSDAVTVIEQQMRYMGFNSNEIKDFLEYWTPHLPNKPYTRLTWLTTGDMEQLAPLRISPKPATLLRAFLDYSGLDTPIEIPAQKLPKVERRGFTVVEWGGLALHKL